MIAHRGRRRRSGLTAIAVMVCLIVITLIAGAALKVGVARRAELRAQEHRLQAEWLAEAGIQRALARIAADPAYNGETWEIPARDLDSPDAALVTITVGREPGDDKLRKILAQAEHPRDPTRRTRHSKQMAVSLDGR